MISADEARRIILENIRPLAPVTVALDNALDCVLAEDIISDEDIPSFDNASMDGYALRAEDVALVPAVVKLVGEIAAGDSSMRGIGPGETMSIMTGAPLPAGCTAVVQHEWTQQPDATHVQILRHVPEGHNIRKAGADIIRGSVALGKGKSVRPQEIGALASLGRRFISVHRKPRVAILATGDELVEIDKPLSPGKIRNSNAHLLSALVGQTGSEVTTCAMAKDRIDDLQDKIKKSLMDDVLIVTGGVSAGKYDLVCQAFENLGINILFRKVNIKPGMPLVFGVGPRSLVFGLPGNPVSTMVTFLKFVRPSLEALAGLKRSEKDYTFVARLTEPISKTDGKRHYIRGIVESDQAGLIVRSTGSQVSNMLSSLTKANCLIIIPEDRNQCNVGEQVEVEFLT